MRTGEQVRVINHEPHPLEWVYASRRYILPSEEVTMVPWELAVLQLGNPEAGEVVKSQKDASGEVFFLPARADEIRRLRTLYDNHVCPSNMCHHHDGLAGIGDETKVFKVPHVTVTDLTSKPIKMIVDDPQGNDTTVAAVTVTENDALRTKLAQQDLDIALLKQQVEMLLPSNTEDATYLSHAPGTPDNPVDLTADKTFLDRQTNLVSSEITPFPDDDLPRDT